MSMPLDAIREVEEFLVKGKKVNAIKHLKKKYGFSVEEAKVVVETMENQAPQPISGPSQAPTVLIGAVRSEVIDILIDRDRVQAIKHVKENLNVSLKQARELVEEVASEVFPPSNWRKGQEAARSSGKVPRLILMGIGVLSLSISAYLHINQQRSIAQSDRINGKVVRMKLNSEGLAAPIIEYRWGGQSWLYASTTYSKPPAFEVNEGVPIYVNREDPADITVDTFGERWIGIAISGILGFLFVGIPLIFAWFSMKR